jgi:hypothetical protein
MNSSNIELVLDGLRSAAADPAALVLLASVLPLLVFVARGSVFSLFALGLMTIGLALAYTGEVQKPVAAFLIVSASALLLALDAGLMRRRMKRMEQRVGSVASALRALELTEERRQVLLARSPLLESVGSGEERRSGVGVSMSTEANSHARGTSATGNGSLDGFHSVQSLRKQVSGTE